MASKKEVVYKEQVTNLLLSILEIAREDVENATNFEKAYQLRLKFQKINSWKRYRACIDLIDDTEHAIFSAFQYQLGDYNNSNNDTGEVYIRLYGILNAVYLQMHAYKELCNLLNYPDRNEVMLRFKKLDIYKLRGIAGAHTSDYEYDSDTLQNTDLNKFTSFRIIQSDLEKTGNHINVLDENNISYEFNLIKSLAEYEKLATSLLIKLIRHMTDTLIIKKGDKIFIKRRLEELLPNLIDYRKVDENKKSKTKDYKRIKQFVAKLDQNTSNNFPSQIIIGNKIFKINNSTNS